MSDEYLFALREGRSAVKLHQGVSFDHRRTGGDPIQFIDDEDTADYLKAKTDRFGTHLFRWVAAEELDRILESAADAAEEIDAGGHDGILDLLMAAEKMRYGPRVTVLDAIGDRSRQIEAELNPDDLTDSVTVVSARASSRCENGAPRSHTGRWRSFAGCVAMSTQDDPFPNLEPYPRGLHFWERDHIGGLFSQAAHGDCASHVAMPRPGSSEIAGLADLPSEATPSDTERQYFWAGNSGWNRDGNRLDATELVSRLSGTVADVAGPGSANGTVAFDIFPTQTGGDYTSRAVVEGGSIVDFLIALPSMNLDNYVTKYKFIQLRYFLKQDASLLRPRNTATIRGGVPYLYFGRDSNPSAPSGAVAGLVEDIVGAYVGESTGDTLDGYPETY